MMQAAVNRIPFPMLRYRHTKRNEIFTTMDLVDSIIAPAMVIPWDIKAECYIETDSIKRSELGFYVVPYEFLCRDDWENIHTQGEKASAEGVNTMIYEEASIQKRTELLQTMMPANIDEENDVDANEDEDDVDDIDEDDEDKDDEDDEDEDDEDEGDEDEDEDEDDEDEDDDKYDVQIRRGRKKARQIIYRSKNTIDL